MSDRKKRGLFQHLQQITEWKNKDWWDTCTEGELKAYSPFMINRFLSMDTELIELVNEIQHYQLTPKQNYDIYMEIIPKRKRYNKYIKGKKEYNKVDAEVLADHFEVSTTDANYYIDILSAIGEKSKIKEIKRMYGERYNEQDI